jgi:hypothetical protein
VTDIDAAVAYSAAANAAKRPRHQPGAKIATVKTRWRARPIQYNAIPQESPA